MIVTGRNRCIVSMLLPKPARTAIYVVRASFEKLGLRSGNMKFSIDYEE